MVPILLSHWIKERRNPFLLLLFITLSIIATLLFTGHVNDKIKIEVFSQEGTNKTALEDWIPLLNRNETFEFVAQHEPAARTKVREGRADFAVMLLQDDYRMIAAIEGPNLQLAEHHIQSVFLKEHSLRAASGLVQSESQFRDDVITYLEQPPLGLRAVTADGQDLIPYNMGLQLMFGFTLFLSMFTVGFKLNSITKDKSNGIWNRLILSPVKKTEIYMGHLFYGFLIGIFQICITLLIFQYVFHYPLGNQYGLILLVIAVYAFTIVAMSILFVGLLRTPEQFMMLYPSIMPIMPLISGIYMPPETITNPILIGLAEAIPITHAMEALLNISLYGTGLNELWMPLSKLLLIAVFCMGVGINLMERR